jgi:two-component system sensor histidine kinase KdpD
MLDSRESITRQLTRHIRAISGIPAVAVFKAETGELCADGPPEVQFPESQMRECARGSEAERRTSTGLSVRPLSLAGPAFGSIAFINPSLSETALNAIAGLAAMALERARVQELAARVEASRQSERLKSTLLDAVAHEFKTPLTSIKAAVSLLEAGEGARRDELVSIIAEETEYLDGLLGEAIEKGRIEAGMLQLDRQPCQVADILAAAIRRMGPSLRDRNIREDIPSCMPDLLVDPHLIGLAIRQLISNAVKYTSPDLPIGISVTCGEGRVQITVEDAGPGIPESEQTRIFEHYYRIQATSSRVPGSGMGLPIARDIVEAHGGKLWVESAPVQGSRFHMTIPYGPQD